MKNNYLVTTESYSEGYPDKMADIISDTILDACIMQDPDSNVNCETLIIPDKIVLAGEIFSQANLTDQISTITRDVIHSIGYTNELYGFDSEEILITNLIEEYPAEDRLRLNDNSSSHQGVVYGYACDETKEYMPLGIWLANRLLERLADLRKSGSLLWLLPYSISKVTLTYEYGAPKDIETIALITQHMPFVLSAAGQNGSGYHRHQHYGTVYHVTTPMVRESMIEEVIKPLIPEQFNKSEVNYVVNPSGRFETLTPGLKIGISGRNLSADTYGGLFPLSGGTFSGKDCSYINRSGSYMARFIAKNIVASGIAKRCMVKIAYANGKPEPVSFTLDFQGTGNQPECEVKRHYEDIYDLTLPGIIGILKLKRPIYQKTAVYGHFGRELHDFTWENIKI